jgi:hypothetical protein
MENQMVVTYNMTEVGEGNSTKVNHASQNRNPVVLSLLFLYTVLLYCWLHKSKALLLNATDTDL